MMVDASALAAMLTDERQARALASRLERATERLTSPLAALDAASLVAEEFGIGPERAAEAVARLVDVAGIRVLALPAALVAPAAGAMARFGASPERPDGLSGNQCLSYAAARHYRMPLLFSGTAFAQTDIEAG